MPSDAERERLASEAFREAVGAEIALHTSDFMYGVPLPVGGGYVISFHAADCAYCDFLAKEAEKDAHRT